MQDINELWKQVLINLGDKISPFYRSNFQRNLQILSIDEKTVHITSKSQLMCDKFIKSFDDFEKAFSDILQKKITIDIQLETEEISNQTIAPETIQQKPLEALQPCNESKQPESKRNFYKENARIDTSFTFENFIISENNEYAANAAKAIAKNPGNTYNPFLIYGGVGLGKTHLMEAIGNELLNTTNLKVMYIPSEELMNQFVTALEGNKMQDFKKKFRGMDVLLLDDIQFFEKKEQLQNEFFNTFNTLYETKKQMVFTCDRHPSILKYLDDRLQSRFQQGLNIDLKPPSYEARIAIIRKNLEIAHKSLSEEIINLLAKNISSNVRDLKAALLKIINYTDMVKKPMTLEKANELLKDSFSDKNNRNVSLDKILKAVSDYFDTSISDIRGKGRNQKVANARHFTFYLATNMTEMTASEIGQEIGGRSHSTVIHGVQNIENKILSDSSIEVTIDELKGKIQKLLD